ncbi:oligomeric Golgi complex subunit 6, partial [Thraustotheca clavata]
MALVLQHRVKKLLASQQSMTSTKNLVDNLQTLVPVEGMSNVSEIRTNLKSQLDNASLGVAEGILSDVEAMLASINQLKQETEAMDGKCKHILAFLDCTERTSNAFVAQAGALSAEKIELQQELEESKQFLAKYQVDPLDIALLESKLDSTDETMSVFFEVLDRVDQIKANCKQLVEENPVSTSMEFLDKVCQHQDVAFDKLYQWTIHHCGNAENEPSRLLHHAIRFLKARSAFYVHCKEVIIAARRAMIVRRFVTALTRGGPNGIPRPIEIHSHDPVRYAGDMLAWIHSSIASENEYFKVLFDGEDSAELQKLVGLAFEGVARPLEVRLEQAISSQGAFLVIYQVVHLLGFYYFTINKLIDPTTELVLILQIT